MQPSISLSIQSHGEADTEILARCIGMALEGGEMFSLEGELGAGKTFLVRAVARALGITESVTSPTFVLQKIYPIPGGMVRTLVHYDLYRIEKYAELLDIGFADSPENSVIFAEWGDKFLNDYDIPVIRVRLDPTGEASRLITITVAHAEYQPFLATLRSAVQKLVPPAQLSEDGIY